MQITKPGQQPDRGTVRHRLLFLGLAASAVPVVCLLAYGLWGETGLGIATAVLPALFLVVTAAIMSRETPGNSPTEKDQLIAMLNVELRRTDLAKGETACLVLRPDNPQSFRNQHGLIAEAEILMRLKDRLQGVLRDEDMVISLPDQSFAIGLRTGTRVDLEGLILLATRLQAATSAGIDLGQGAIHQSVSIGFCLANKSPEPNGAALLRAAVLAAAEAAENAPAAIRAYSPELALRQTDRSELRDGLEAAFADCQIRAYFQPQLSTDTGLISGFEALARWHHPTRGLIPPVDFLPLIDAAGLSEQLAEVMLQQVLTALVNWDRGGLHVPNVGINFSDADLRNPRLVDKMKWELDRFGLTPDRLSVEILETVVVDTDDDMAVRNIAALADLGCGIDLDDFGTGNASISGIRRFAVSRIKIDRSLVTFVDTDQAQQRMISALVALADELGLDTLAEGVETSAEHAMLAQLGCRHVQGFGIARPMPFRDTADWIAARQAAVAVPPPIGRAPGATPPVQATRRTQWRG